LMVQNVYDVNHLQRQIATRPGRRRTSCNCDMEGSRRTKTFRPVLRKL
jgi:hypothetical protein